MTTRQSTNRPNVILFLTDQQRWDTSSLHGNPMGLTPNFDRLARSGTHVRHAFTPQPLCGPARASIQTGTYASTHGCVTNAIGLPDDATTLAHCFGAAGYRTGYVGKWHLAGSDPVPPAERGGYDYWLGANTIELTSDAYRCDVFDGAGNPVRLPGYRVDALVDAAIRWVDEQRDNPFLLCLSLLEPHQQNHRAECVAPRGYRERYLSPWLPPDLAALPGTAHRQLPGYYGAVARIDEALGRLQDALISLGIDERTIVLYTADHGCHFGTRIGGYKRSCHESSVRLPMAAWGPGFDGGGEIRDLVSLIDVAPTLLDAAGLAIPENVQGRSILPLIRGDSVDWPDDVFIQISESAVGRAIRTSRWKYYVQADGADGRADAAGAPRYREQHLYDLDADPYELNDLAGIEAYIPVATVLRDRLLHRMAEVGEKRPDIEPAPSRPSGPYVLDDGIEHL